MSDQSERLSTQPPGFKIPIWSIVIVYALIPLVCWIANHYWGENLIKVAGGPTNLLRFVSLMTPGMIILIALSLIVLIRAHESVIQEWKRLVEQVLPKMIEGKLEKFWLSQGKNLLRDTIVQGVIEDAVKASSGGIRHHEVALSLLETLHQADKRLAPAIQIIASHHIAKCNKAIKGLQDDHGFSIPGVAQVGISEAFADRAEKTIVFYDPISSDINKWSHIFTHFVCKRLKEKSEIAKIQYVCYDGDDSNKQPDGNLKAFQAVMEEAGFTVFKIHQKVINESRYEIFKSRLEIYDDQCVVRIESKHEYKDEDLLLTGVTTVDSRITAALKLLSVHGIKADA